MAETQTGALALEGVQTMATAHLRLAEGRRLTAEGDLIADLSAVTVCDSAALALLLDWQRTARGAGTNFMVRDMPVSLRNLADLYGVTELLPAEA